MSDWHIVVPLRGGAPGAKSRLVGPRARKGIGLALAFAFAKDVVTTALEHDNVARITVLTSHPPTAAAFRDLPRLDSQLDDRPDLNGSIRSFSQRARSSERALRHAVLMADLPALTVVDLDAALHAADGHDRAVVGDRHGVGTCMLTCDSQQALSPHFGGDSLERHRRAGHVELSLPRRPSIWTDVDTPADLLAALDLGVGDHTRRVLAQLSSIGGAIDAITSVASAERAAVGRSAGGG